MQNFNLRLAVDQMRPAWTGKMAKVSIEEVAAGAAWAAGIAREWADDLGDARQDIYTQEDGEALRPWSAANEVGASSRKV